MSKYWEGEQVDPNYRAVPRRVEGSKTMEERCQLCNKLLKDHYGGEDRGEDGNYCGWRMNDNRRWTPPAPQGALFDASAPNRSYEEDGQ